MKIFTMIKSKFSKKSGKITQEVSRVFLCDKSSRNQLLVFLTRVDYMESAFT